MYQSTSCSDVQSLEKFRLHLMKNQLTMKPITFCMS